MREIKFRAYETIPKFMNNSVRITAHPGGKTTFEVAEGYGWIPVSKENIMQYTGLKDVRGVEIYEGDILWDSTGELIGAVKFDEGTFVVGEDVLSDWYYESEIIGNRFENPKLLEAD